MAMHNAAALSGEKTACFYHHLASRSSEREMR
jgi:hypothetical protein